MSIPKIIKTFSVGDRLCEGDLADIYMTSDRAAVLKIARDRRDNDLLENEVRVLSRLYPKHQREGNFYRYLPRILDTAQISDRLHVTVFPYFKEYLSLAEIIQFFPNGVDYRDMAWMYKRILAALGFIHSKGVLHGAILPTHVLVHPIEHGAKILDWSYAMDFALTKKDPDPVDPVTPAAPSPPTKGLSAWDLIRQSGNMYKDDDDDDPPPVVVPGGPPTDPSSMYVKAISVDYQAFYAPEILHKETPSPATDIYMASKCMVALLGGNAETNVIPDTVPIQIRAFLQASLLVNPQKRPQEAWKLHEDFDGILVNLVGKPTYRPFSFPSPA
jgi:serine/threonine protein kinase